MKILVIHNRYRIRAGEDVAFEGEVNLLRIYGHQVETWDPDNQNINVTGFLKKIKLGINTIWSQKSYKEMIQKLKILQPDIVHVHNIIPLLSPSIFYACQSQKIPVVQTLHNYRLGCPTATFFRSGKVCELCLEQSLFEGIRYGCYRNSRLQTATIAGMLQIHRWLKTWSNQVDGYIAVSQFLKEKITKIGIPAEKIYVKPNFINLEKLKEQGNNFKLQFGTYYLYVGRLVEEKGITLLLEGYALANSSFPLVIIGMGELENAVRKAAEKNPLIRYEGQQSKEEVLKWMQGAISLIFPSLWYECCPLTIMEAYSQSLPVIGANLGSTTNLIKPNQTGLLFSPLTAEGMATRIKQVESNPSTWIELKENLAKFTDSIYLPNFNCQRLIEIYSQVINHYQLI